MPDYMDRLWAKVKQVESGCWEFQGRPHTNGYGRMYADGRMQYTHRLMYQRLVGPIPKGLVIDHLCRNRLCCNPEHLEAVTERVNIARGRGSAWVMSHKTHCKHGHEYTPENTIWHGPGEKWRRCRACTTGARRAARAKRRNAEEGNDMMKEAV